MPLPEVAIGVLGSIVIVQAVASLAIEQHEMTTVDQSRVLQFVGGNITVMGIGMSLLLYGLSREYLKTADFGLLGGGELIPFAVTQPHAIYVGAMVMLISVVLSFSAVFYVFVLHIDPESVAE